MVVCKLKQLLETLKKFRQLAVDGSVDRALEIGEWDPVQAYSGRLHDCIGLSFIDSVIPDKMYEFSYSSLLISYPDLTAGLEM